jgi:hypothetical protein
MAQALKSVPAELIPYPSGTGVSILPLRTAPDARQLVKTLAIPRMLAGAGGDIVQLVVELEEFGESEPLLLAGAALAYSWLDIAESALDRARSELAQSARPDVAEVVSLALLDMAMARQRGDAAAGLAHAHQLQELVGNLTISERASTPELSALIDYYVAGFELCCGNLNTARSNLERGAGRFRQWVDHGGLDVEAGTAEQQVRANCPGQLAWIDAFCGDLRRARWYATSLISDWAANSDQTGVGFAHLALALTHIERGDFELTAQHLSYALSGRSEARDPLLVAAQRLTQARLAVATDEMQRALRLLQSSARDVQVPSGWFADQFLIATAEAYLASDEPQQAIATLTPEPKLATAEARLVLVRAFRAADDHRTAEAIMCEVPAEPLALSLLTQVQRWLLQAELASDLGQHDRAASLVDRALRAAQREELRTTVGLGGGWLRSL